MGVYESKRKHLFKMKQQIITLVSVLIITLTACNRGKAENDLNMWYDKPATDWYEALPIGNGTLGAMVYGDVPKKLYS